MGGPGSGAGIFDGIDVDWEWPGTGGHPNTVFRPEDRQNYTKLLAEFRKQLNDVNSELLLSIVTPANIRDIKEMEMRKIGRIVDFVNMIGYDFHVSSQPTTNHQPNLRKPKAKNKKDLPDDFDDFWLTQAVRDHLKAGMPRYKLNVGAPFYGHGWTGVSPDNNGLYQAATGPAQGTWSTGVEDYKVLKDKQVLGFTRYWDYKARSPWLFDGTTFWTFDDPPVMCKKANYVRRQQLRGMMFWELSGDDEQGALISAMDNCMHPISWWHNHDAEGSIGVESDD